MKAVTLGAKVEDFEMAAWKKEGGSKMIKTLHIVHDGKVREDMSIEEIFDSDKYNQFTGVTFSVSPNFINQYLQDFEEVTIVVGIPEQRVQVAVNEAAKNLQGKVRSILDNDPVELYQGLSTQIKKKLVEKSIKLYIPLGYVIHSKFYLLKNTETGDTRLIMGSANLSDQAFNSATNQFENIHIFDNTPMTAIYEDYYLEKMIPILSDYMPKELLAINKKRIKKLESSDGELLDEMILLNNTDVNKIKEKGVLQTLEETDEKIALGILPGKVIEEMRNLADNRQEEERERRRQQETEITSFEIVKEAVSKRAKTPKLKGKQAMKNIVKKIVKVKVQIADNQGLPERSLIVNSPAQRNMSKTPEVIGLFVPSESNKDRLIPYGRRASEEEIATALKTLNKFMKTFEQFTIRYDDTYGARVMEAIFYAFTSTQLFEVKRRARSEEERNDIPQFLFLGGTAGSGKSSLMKAISKMIDGHRVLDYNSIIPIGQRRKSETVNALGIWMSEENVAPLLIDEIPDEFYTVKNYGNELIVNLSNRMAANPNAFPALIGTTNADGYTLEERARRRSYYLKLDKVFNEEFRKESQPAYNEVYELLDNKLYLDFIIRLAEKLDDDTLDWAQFEGGGKIDFLYHTREIFKEYYEIAEMPIPRYFPMTRYDDSKETNQEKWRKLFLGTSRDEFVYDDFTGNILFKTAILDENVSMFGSGKPSDIYKNALSPMVIIGSKDSVDIELETHLFFEWIEVDNPYEREYVQTLKKYYLNNKATLKEDIDTNTIVIDMSKVVPGRQIGAIEQYKFYLPQELIVEEHKNYLVELKVEEFCEWLGVEYKVPNIFSRIFSYN